MNILFLIIIIILNISVIISKMSWSNTNAGLIKQLKGNGVIHSAIVENAMLSVDRGNFIYNNPYVDTPQLIGHGQTISAPHMHGILIFLFLFLSPLIYAIQLFLT